MSLVIYVDCNDLNGLAKQLQNETDSYDKSKALIQAVQCGYIDMVELLLLNGAYVDTFEGMPLKMAVYMNNRKMAKFLLDNGARIHADDEESFQICVEKKFFKMTELLTNHKKNTRVKSARK